MKISVLILILMALSAPVYAQDSSSVVQGYNPDYNLLIIILALFMFYLITYLLYANKNIEKRTYKQIWSLILVGSFLFVGIGGIIMSLLVDYQMVLPSNFNLLFWHVESGIILSISFIFHIHIYIRPIMKIMSNLK